MRDLAKDSRWLQRQEPNRDNHISVNFYRAYDWLNQAIRAEAEVERLQALLETLNGECVVCDSVSEITKVQAENAKLRKVAEAARGAYDYYDMVWDGGIAHELGQALAELDEEGD